MGLTGLCTSGTSSVPNHPERRVRWVRIHLSTSRADHAGDAAAIPSSRLLVGSGGTMSAVEILAILKKFGNPQTAAIYKRHGAGDNVFGTLTSEIAKLRKKIKANHTLALELWRTGNAEARILALQVFDPLRLNR